MDMVLEKFKDAVEAMSKAEPSPSVAIVLHENPDPDCMGAAYGMQRLLKHWNQEIKCVVIYSGEISHPQNKTMVNVLNLQMSDRQDIPPLTQSSANAFVVLDTTPERCGLSGIECLLTVDHHKGDTKKSKLKDIRLIGSTSSIIWSYLQQAGVTLNKNKDEDSDVATALVVGIKTDTTDLASENVSDLDFEAYRALVGSINQRKLAVILKYPLPPYHFELRSRLDQEGNTKLDAGIFIGGIGYIAPSKRDALPTIADERSRVEGTDTAFIFAIVGENIEVSVRSNGFSVDVNDIIQNIFGKEHGGGKMGAGAAKIPMNFLSVDKDSEEIQEKMWIAIREKLMAMISEEMSKHR
jgi:nanoRNase/pAp phosphatase (c-di-AMP/oligoRNAs hydrolase)